MVWILLLLEICFAARRRSNRGIRTVRNRPLAPAVRHNSSRGITKTQNRRIMAHIRKDTTPPTAVNPPQRVANTGNLRIEKFRNPYPPGHANHNVHMYDVVRPSGRPVVKGETAAIRTAVKHLKANRNRNPRSRFNQGGYNKNTGASNVNLEGTTRRGKSFNIHMDYNQNGAAPHTNSNKQPIAAYPRYNTQLVNARGNPSLAGSSIHVSK
jgi:hypothetical protein